MMDIGEAQGAVKKVQPAQFKFVENVFHLCQAGSTLQLQFPFVGGYGCLQRINRLVILFKIIRLSLDKFRGLRHDILSHAEGILELELQPGGIIQSDVNILFQFVQMTGGAQLEAFRLVQRRRLGHDTLVDEARHLLLHARIEARFSAMLAQGFVAEVEGLMQLPEMRAERPAMRAVGYRQLWAMLAGNHDRAEAERRALAATRQLAKRQLTWLRHEACEQCFAMEESHLPAKVEAVLHSHGVQDALSVSSG